MKRCPENDKILLFCERELSEVEQAQFELHLTTCSECRKEVEQIRAEDSLLREGVEETFSRHRVASRVMQQIRNSTPDQQLPELALFLADRFRAADDSCRCQSVHTRHCEIPWQE